MIVKYRNIYFFGILFFYLFICFFGVGVFSATAGLDANSIASLEVDDINLGASYAVMSYIYQLIPQGLIFYFTILLGVVFIFGVFNNAYKVNNLIIISLLLSIPCILVISSFQKDLILVLFTVPCAYIISSNRGNLFKLLSIFAIYLIYATVFRNYYYLIMLIFFCFYFFKLASWNIRLLILLGMICLLIILPNNIYYMLQSSRDIVNQHRIGMDVIGNRTAFNNPLIPDSFFNFVYNYIYAILRLNFGFFFNYGLRDLIFMVYPLIYMYYVFNGLKEIIGKNFIAASLIASHILVISLFEPDTGSYARHLSSTLPYLAIIIASRFNK